MGIDEHILGCYFSGERPEDGEWISVRWYKDGRYHPEHKSALDLVKMPVAEEPIYA